MNSNTAEIPYQANLALQQLLSDPKTTPNTHDMAETLLNHPESIANPAASNQKDYIDQAMHLLIEIINTIVDNPAIGETILGAGCPYAKTFIAICKKEHIVARLLIELSQISTVYDDLTKEYENLENISYDQLSLKDRLQKKLTSTEGMRKLVAIFQLALPFVAEETFDIIKDQVETWIGGLIAATPLVTKTMDVASKYAGNKLDMKHAQKLIDYCVESALDIADIKYESESMKNTINYLSTSCASQFQTLKTGIRSATSYLSSWSSNSYGSWFSKSQNPIDADVAQRKEVVHSPETDFISSDVDFIKSISGTLKSYAESEESPTQATNSNDRTLLYDISGFEAYRILMSLTIVTVSLLSVICV